MATYKVPQNVEADDKLIGPFSLKQFIFIILGLGSGYLTFFFATKIHILASVPFVPFTAAFLILGIYQRSDQPVEVYLASAIRFRLKPHKRIWDQEGYEERVIITAPPKIEKHYTKGYSQEQVSSHLGNLSRLMDTRGWASKLANDWQNPTFEATATSDRLVQPDEITTDAAETPRYAQPLDVQDENSSMVARDFEAKIQQAENETHQSALRALERARQSSATEPSNPEPVTFTKYPAMHQKTLQPAADEPAADSPQVPVAPAPAATQATQTPPSNTPAPLPALDDTDDGEVEIKLH